MCINGKCVLKDKGRNGDICMSAIDNIVKPDDLPIYYKININTTCEESVNILETQGADIISICHDRTYNYANVCCNMCLNKYQY